MSDEKAAPDRLEPSRRLAAWERDPGCAVCEVPITDEELEEARVIPFEDGDRVAHPACYSFRREQGGTMPRIQSNFGMQG